MADPRPEDLRSKLLNQDPVFHTPRYQEHRMQLEQQLLRAEQRERLTKWIVIVAFLTALGLMVPLASRTFGAPDPFDKQATVLSVTLGVIYVLAQIVFFLGIASYFTRFLPRLRRLRDELRDEAIRELREDVRELRRRVEDRQQPPESGK